MNEEIKEILRYLEECVANDNRFLIGNTNATKLSYYITNLQEENKKLKEANEEHRKINGDLRKENQKLVKVIDTILDFNFFKEECPLNFGFEDEKENKSLNVFYEDEWCETNCNDEYKKCWLKYFNKLTELKGGDDNA